MKGITKDHETITMKDCEILFHSMKDQCKKNCITSQAIYSNSPVLVGSVLHLWYNSGI